MRKTGELGLRLPDGSDPFSLEPMNENMEILDAVTSALTPAPGDILYAVRTPGAGWLPCNGGTVPAADYPALAGLLLPDLTERTDAMSVTSGHFYANGLATDGSKWAVGGYKQVSSTSTAYIAWAEEPGGEWTVVDLFAGTYNNTQTVTALAYGGGVWCAAVTYSANTSLSGIYTAEDPAGPWTRAGDSPYSSPANLAYLDGVYTAMCTDGDNRYLYQAKKLSGPWGKISYPPISGLTSFTPVGITVVRGFYIMFGQALVDKAYYSALVCSSDVEGPWQSLLLEDDNNARQ